jgi:hypothetical protein
VQLTRQLRSRKACFQAGHFFLLLALRDPERIALDHGDKGHRSAADVGAVSAEAVMDLKGSPVVLIADRVGVATTTPGCLHALLAHRLSSFSPDIFPSTYAYYD